MRIALFVTCLADTLFPEAGRATVRLLERLGHQVEFPAAQTCCGQMHVNTGYLRDALPLVRRYVEVFEGCEAIVVPSGSCTGSIRHQHAMVARRYGDEALARRAEAVAARTYELSQLLVDVLGVEDVGAYYPHRVTYHPTCHSLRLLRVGDRPLRLLRHVAGIDLVELPDADTCCGFGGTFAVKNADTSTAMLADKMRSVLDTQAEVCTAGDSSCLMHIGGGLSRLQTGHPDRAPGGDPGLGAANVAARSAGALSARAARRGPGGCPVSAPTFLGLPTAPRGVGHLRGDEPFPVAARRALADTQLRRNLGKATRTIRAKRAAVVGELPDWEELRDAGQAIKAGAMAHLDRYLEQLEEQVTARGGVVHWARDANDANAHRGRPGPRDRRHRGGQGQVDRHRRDRPQRRAGRRGHHRARDRPGRADRPARPRPAVAHPGPGHPPEPGRDPGHLPARDGRRGSRADRLAGRARRGGPAAPAPPVPVRQGRDQRGQLRRSRRPARCAWSSPRATAGCA